MNMRDPSGDNVSTHCEHAVDVAGHADGFILKLFTIVKMAIVQCILLGICLEPLMVISSICNHCSMVESSTAKVLVFLMMRD